MAEDRTPRGTSERIPLIESLLAEAVESAPSGGGDVLLKPGSLPRIRVEGELRPVGHRILRKVDLDAFAERILRPEQVDRFRRGEAVDSSYGFGERGRFRVHMFHTIRGPAFVLRAVPHEVPSLEELGMPRDLATVLQMRHGLCLFAGGAGSGKSTTLRSVVDALNRRRSCHIVTIEDPIEFLFRDRRSSVTQIEVGSDVPHIEAALEWVIRLDPDVIVVEEVSEPADVRWLLPLAEAGRLVMATLEADTVVALLRGILDALPVEELYTFSHRLARVLQVALCQRLVPGRSSRAVAITEVAWNCPPVRAWLLDQGSDRQLRTILQENTGGHGTHTFDQSLTKAVHMRKIDPAVALEVAYDPVPFERLLSALT